MSTKQKKTEPIESEESKESNENVATMQNVRDVLLILEKACETLKEAVTLMEERNVEAVKTTNYKSSGKNAAQLIAKFAAGLPGAVKMKPADEALNRLSAEPAQPDQVIDEKRSAAKKETQKPKHSGE